VLINGPLILQNIISKMIIDIKKYNSLSAKLFVKYSTFIKESSHSFEIILLNFMYLLYILLLINATS